MVAFWTKDVFDPHWFGSLLRIGKHTMSCTGKIEKSLEADFSGIPDNWPVLWGNKQSFRKKTILSEWRIQWQPMGFFDTFDTKKHLKNINNAPNSWCFRTTTRRDCAARKERSGPVVGGGTGMLWSLDGLPRQVSWFYLVLCTANVCKWIKFDGTLCAYTYICSWYPIWYAFTAASTACSSQKYYPNASDRKSCVDWPVNASIGYRVENLKAFFCWIPFDELT